MKTAKFLKNKTVLSIAVMLVCICRIGYAQHHTTAKQGIAGKEDSFKAAGIMKQALTDPELKGFLFDASILELAPGFMDTVDHRHDAELFVYVLEGTVETQLENKLPVTYTKGQMFYEYPNVLHTMLKNLSSSQPAKLMLNFIIKEGRQAYKREYPVVTPH